MGVGFLAPEIFIAGAALALALLATYLLKPSRPTRRVSSTLLWLAAFHDLQAHKPWRRVPPTVLLLLQMLALAALVGAVARPFVLNADAAGLEAVVLLDVSASMQATDIQPSRFQAARARAQQMIDDLEPGQALALISLGAEPRVVAPRTADRAVLHAALDSLQPTAESANLPAALSLAGSLADGHPDAQVIVLGDGSLDRTRAPATLPFAVRYIPFGSKSENLAVSAFGTRVLDGHLTALASVANYGSQLHTVTLELRIDGQRFDARVLDVAAGQSVDARWDDIPTAGRVLEARLLDPDALALDNAAWSVLAGERPTRVLLVSDANVFLERALALRPGTQVTHVFPADYDPDATLQQPYDLVVYDGFAPPALPSSGSLLLLHPPAANGLVGSRDDVPISGLSAARENEPLLEDVPLEGIHIARARRLDVPAWADVVLDAPETPLLMVGQQGGHRAAVLGFDIHESDLPLQPGFPVLTQHLLDWLVPGTSVATPVVRAGEPAALVPLPEAESVEVVSPDGVRTPAAPPFPPPPFGQTDVPGVYQVVQRDASGRETVSAFAANFLNPRESRLAPGEAVGAPSGRAVSRQVTAAPRETWEALAVVAFAVLAIEWWAFHRQ